MKAIKQFGAWMESMQEYNPTLFQTLQSKYNELFFESSEDVVEMAKNKVGEDTVPVDDIDADIELGDADIGLEVDPELDSAEQELDAMMKEML